MSTPASIQLYTRTTLQWASSPDNAVVLLSGQPGIELLGSGKFAIKIGNGVNIWSALNYTKADVLDPIRTEIDNIRTARSFKLNVKACATGNIGSLSGSTTLDTVDLDPGDAFLLPFQTDKKQNGVYVMPTLGAWIRREDFDAPSDNISGSTVKVTQGDLYKNREFTCINNGPPIIGTDNILFIDTTSDNFNNEIKIDITGASTLDLSAFSGYNIINVVSSNASETIDTIISNNSNSKIQIRSKTSGFTPLAVTFRDLTTPTTGNISINSATGTSFVANSAKSGFFEIQFRNSFAFHVGGVQAYN